MSVYQGSPGTARESLRKEAARRGISVYQVRKERAERLQGAPVKRINWSLMPEEQRDAIRARIPRRQWREFVFRTNENIKKYQDTHYTIQEFEYWYGYENFGLLKYLEKIERLMKSRSYERKVFWYHGRGL
jgi:hypothetical protein